ncbi:sigma factor [Brevundimonas sp. LM2]|uniref:sigma factor n=1 Tax=Brevundimonas sp. LM2 TaxID=1938605 RepID=UPI0012373A34
MTAALLRHRGKILRFLTRRTRCSTTAEDLVQDVYLRLRRRSFRSPIASSARASLKSKTLMVASIAMF